MWWLLMVKKGILETYDYLTDDIGYVIGKVTYKYVDKKNIKFFRFDTRFLKNFITLASSKTRDIDIALVPYKTNSNIALLCARIPGDKKKCFALDGKTQGSKWF